MRMKRILLLNTNLETGGAERQLVYLAQHLDRSQWSITLLLLEGKGPFLQDIPNDVQVISLSKAYPTNPLGKVIWALRHTFAIRNLLQANAYDVVLTFLWFPTLLVALAVLGKRKRPKLVWSVQGDLVQDFRYKAFSWIRRFLVKTFVPRKVDHYIAISNGVARSVYKTLSPPEGKVNVIHNAIDLQGIKQMAKEKTLVQKPLGSLWLISVGRLALQKGHKDLISAIAQVKNQLPTQLKLFILGEGPERKNLEALINSVELNHQVELVGLVRNPYVWLKKADLFVFPSRWEPFGIALAEAMALGLPVIATETDGAKDMVEPKVDGVLVPIGDIDALSGAILDLARSPERRMILGSNAQKKAQQFDISIIIPEYEQVLKKMVS